MNQAALITIANELNHDQMRVLMALLAELDYENYIQVAQMDIAEALTMQKTNVSRAVKNLIDFGIILEGPKIGRRQNVPPKSPVRLERHGKQPQESTQKRPQRHSGRQNLISGMPQMASFCGVSPILHRIKTNAPYRPCHAIASVAVSHVQHAAVSPSPGLLLKPLSHHQDFCHLLSGKPLKGSVTLCRRFCCESIVFCSSRALFAFWAL